MPARKAVRRPRDGGPRHPQVEDAGRNVVRQTTIRSGRRYTVTHAVDARTGLPFSTRVYGPVNGAEAEYLSLSPEFNGARQLTSLSASGKRVGVGYPDYIDVGKFELKYDGEGRLSELRIPTIINPPLPGFDPKPGDTLSLSYTSAHGLWSMRYQRYAVDSIAGQVLMRDSLGRVVRHRAARGDSVKLYAYGVRGDLTTYNVNQGPATNCPVNAKLGENCGYWGLLKRQATYSSDRAGNPTYAGEVIGTGNRLTQFRGYTMEYDARGNLTRRYITSNPTAEDRRYFWNGLGQLDSVRLNGVTVARYQYDGMGRRVRRVYSNGAVREYVYDGDNIVMELDANGVILAGWVHGGVDQPLAMRRGDSIYYYLRNHQGSIVALMNKSGAIRNQYRYDPWGGSEMSMDSVINFYRYTDREYDSETGLYYYRARYYDPALRRFISKDPIGLDGGINPYMYVGNDPVNSVDPSGLCPKGVIDFPTLGLHVLARCLEEVMAFGVDNGPAVGMQDIAYDPWTADFLRIAEQRARDAGEFIAAPFRAVANLLNGIEGGAGMALGGTIEADLGIFEVGVTGDFGWIFLRDKTCGADLVAEGTFGGVLGIEDGKNLTIDGATYEKNEVYGGSAGGGASVVVTNAGNWGAYRGRFDRAAATIDQAGGFAVAKSGSTWAASLSTAGMGKSAGLSASRYPTTTVPLDPASVADCASNR